MNCKVPKIFNISEKHKTFTITPMATGSRTFCEIIDNFDFNTYHFCNNNLEYYKDKMTHNHTFSLFPNHEDYKLIMTGRNPYNKLVNNFKKELRVKKHINKNFNFRVDFTDFVYNKYYRFTSLTMTKKFQLELKDDDPLSLDKSFIGDHDLLYPPNGTFNRKIDYKVRLDFIEEDYKSIDFIKNSEYFKIGLLEKALSKKTGLMDPILITQYNLPLHWQEYYDQETADLIYKFSSNYFDTFEFEKDSWKK